MYTNNEYRFKVSLSRKRYPEKLPKNDPEYGNIFFDRNELGIDDFVGAIEDGYAYTYVYDQQHFHIKDKTKYAFRYTKALAFDIDDTDCSLETAIENCAYPPTVAYRTYSDGEEGKCSYRFVYMFDDYINAFNFDATYDAVARINGFTCLDKREANQFYFGTNKQGSYVSYLVYSLSDFGLSQTTYSTHSPLFISGDGMYFLFPDEYYEVKRLWRYDREKKRGYIVRYTDEGTKSRRKQLYCDGQLLKKINNITDKDYMLKVLKNELRLYYDNTVDEITEKDLKGIVDNIFKYPFECKCAEHPLFKINVPYWKEKMSVGNKTYSPITAINICRKQIKYNMFKKLYNKELSYKDNITNMKNNGLDISMQTYYRYLEQLKNEFSQSEYK